MGKIPEPGELVKARSLTWRVEDVRDLGTGYEVKLLGEEETNKGIRISVLTQLEELEPISREPEELGIPVSPEHWKFYLDSIGFSMAHSNEFLLSLLNSRIELEEYQLLPIVKMREISRPRLLIADDVGLGKTIEAGLITMELASRGRANRILIVTPASLQEQWRDEMKEKFNLDFKIFDSSTLKKIEREIRADLNPWEVYDKVITSIDYVKREEVLKKLERAKWDLVIIDEAHYLSYVNKKTDRARFGEKIAKRCEALLLLTATPHTGKPESFKRILKLLDERLVRGRGEELSPEYRKHVVRRLKGEIKDKSGRKKFEIPEVVPIGLKFTEKEKKVYEKLKEYTDSQYKVAIRTKGAQSVAFAMIVLRKRLLSSFHSLKESLKKRIDTLETESYDMDTSHRMSYLEGNTLTEKQIERFEKDLLRTSLARTEEELEKERETLGEILRLVEEVLEEGDSKSKEILRLVNEITSKGEKVIVFTEYIDTQKYLSKYLSENGFHGKIAILNGKMTQKERREQDEFFNSQECSVLIATDAVSEGLNFQKNCSVLIHNELPWNPNRLEQRNGRVDRWGQKKRVKIFNLYYEDSYEQEVLSLLVEKLERIRSDLGSVTDVLGLLDQEKIRDSIMSIETEEDLRKTEKLMEEMVEEALKIYNREIREKALFRDVSVDSELSSRQLNRNKSLPGFEDLEGLVRHMIEIRGGSFQEVSPRIFKIVVPKSLQRRGVKEEYEKTTFSREVAVSNREVEFLTPMHPLVRAILSEYRKSAMEGTEDYSFTYKFFGREEGLLFVFLAKFQNGLGRLVEERLIPVFLDSKLRPYSGEREEEMLLSIGSHGSISRNEIERGKEFWRKSVEIAREFARERANEISEEIRSFIERIVDSEKRDLDEFLKEEKSRLEGEIEKIRKKYGEDERVVRMMVGKIENTIYSLEKSVKERKQKLEKSLEIRPQRVELIASALIFPEV